MQLRENNLYPFRVTLAFMVKHWWMCIQAIKQLGYEAMKKSAHFCLVMVVSSMEVVKIIQERQITKKEEKLNNA